MDEQTLKALLLAVRNGETEIENALQQIKALPYDDLGFAKIDYHRHLRQGFPEVIFCQGKTSQQVAQIVMAMEKKEKNILATRASADDYQEVKKLVSEAEYYEQAKIIIIRKEKKEEGTGLVLVVTAGTSDIPVAEEAALTAETMGSKVERIYDVGVAGIHRLLQQTDKLRQAKVLVVVAGMEGALASVVGGLVDKPVIAVPTSIGYGASFHGLAALLSMLNSCASGVSVVNIDNGFGGGYCAALINRLGED